MLDIEEQADLPSFAAARESLLLQQATYLVNQIYQKARRFPDQLHCENDDVREMDA